MYIVLKFEENVSPEVVNEIQFLTNIPDSTQTLNELTRLGDTFVFERTDPEALGIREPSNPRKATKVYTYKVKKTIQIAYNMDIVGENSITMPDGQKIRLAPFPLKNIDDERNKILAAPSTSAYKLDTQKMPYAAAIKTISLPTPLS